MTTKNLDQNAKLITGREMRLSALTSKTFKSLAEQQQHLLTKEAANSVIEATQLLGDCYSRGGLVISAASAPTFAAKAAHFFEELVGRYNANRCSLPALTPAPSEDALEFVRRAATKEDLVVFFAPEMNGELLSTIQHLESQGTRTVVLSSDECTDTSVLLPLPSKDYSLAGATIGQRVLCSLYLHILCESVEEPPGSALPYAVVTEHFGESIELFKACGESQELAAPLEELEDLLASRLDGVVLCCGNGGSACDALEFSAQWNAHPDRKGSVAFHAGEVGLLTCNANDFGYESVFSRSVEGLGSKLRLLIGISTSGNSPNILRAVESAVHYDVPQLFLGGKSGGALKDAVKLSYVVPSHRTARIQEIHLGLLSVLAHSTL